MRFIKGYSPVRGTVVQKPIHHLSKICKHVSPVSNEMQTPSRSSNGKDRRGQLYESKGTPLLPKLSFGRRPKVGSSFALQN
jgi:hypothetical protein